MQTIFITGRIGKDAETREARGDAVCSFNVAVDQGYGENKATHWFRCSIWGKRSGALQRYLTKGTKVAVQGELTIGEYQGKPQFDVRVNEIDMMGGGERQESAPRSTNRKSDDLEDEVPF